MNNKTKLVMQRLHYHLQCNMFYYIPAEQKKRNCKTNYFISWSLHYVCTVKLLFYFPLWFESIATRSLIFLFNVLLCAVISGGFIILALAGCRSCPCLKSYFQCRLTLWLVLWLINNARDPGIPVGVKRSGRTSCTVCVCHPPSCFQKPLMDPQEMWVLHVEGPIRT